MSDQVRNRNQKKKPEKVNTIGFSRADYRGSKSTLCQGCGHNSISNQIISALYELDVMPEDVMKFSGIGCSSKSITYFLGRSFGFNGLHGRMPSFATGASFANTNMRVIGISGDGDTASIGMGQFKHAVRRNTNMLYIVENNGVYGLTKGQFSATVQRGLTLKHHGRSRYLPVDICMEALVSHATFVARSFAGDPQQVKNLIKAAYCHSGIAVLDIISPCVTFNNQANTMHSYSWGRDHESPLHGIEFVPSFVPAREEITVEDFEKGGVKEVTLHDNSVVFLKKLEEDYDPTDRWEAYRLLEEAYENDWLITGLIYVNPDVPNLHELYGMVNEPLNRLPNERLRPPKEAIDIVNRMMF
ncbi:MAG: 2-oxoacid:ferredoxin oxidoreductase subunit beta [Anaerolineaceae bacterium]|nr:2-oxoacid:ferredoxin oxidoreductase subunit beta [Anaerolineaceae bacterium]